MAKSQKIGFVKFFVLVAVSRAIGFPIQIYFAENRKVFHTNNERVRPTTTVGGLMRRADESKEKSES